MPKKDWVEPMLDDLASEDEVIKEKIMLPEFPPTGEDVYGLWPQVIHPGGEELLTCRVEGDRSHYHQYFRSITYDQLREAFVAGRWEPYRRCWLREDFSTIHRAHRRASIGLFLKQIGRVDISLDPSVGKLDERKRIAAIAVEVLPKGTIDNQDSLKEWRKGVATNLSDSEDERRVVLGAIRTALKNRKRGGQIPPHWREVMVYRWLIWGYVDMSDAEILDDLVKEDCDLPSKGASMLDAIKSARSQLGLS